MMAVLTGKYLTRKNCVNCLKKTRESIEDFFKYLDCDKDSIIDAEDIHTHTGTIISGYNNKKAF